MPQNQHPNSTTRNIRYAILPAAIRLNQPTKTCCIGGLFQAVAWTEHRSFASPRHKYAMERASLVSPATYIEFHPELTLCSNVILGPPESDPNSPLLIYIYCLYLRVKYRRMSRFVLLYFVIYILYNLVSCPCDIAEFEDKRKNKAPQEDVFSIRRNNCTRIRMQEERKGYYPMTLQERPLHFNVTNIFLDSS